MGDYIAVQGNGSWGGPGKIHAARLDSGRTMSQGSSARRFTSRCGQRYCQMLKGEPTFASIIHLDQCQRCVRLIDADSVANVSLTEADQRGLAVALILAFDHPNADPSELRRLAERVGPTCLSYFDAVIANTGGTA